MMFDFGSQIDTHGVHHHDTSHPDLRVGRKEIGISVLILDALRNDDPGDHDFMIIIMMMWLNFIF